MTTRIIRKLSRNNGESIAEVLIAVLISSFALVMLATMLTSTMKLVAKSKTKTENYSKEGNKLVEMDAADKYADGTVAMYLGDDEFAPKCSLSDDDDASDIDVEYFLNEESGWHVVVSYKKAESGG